jgi:RND family efflux transporter MFP subunit
MRVVKSGVWGICVGVLVLAGCHGSDANKGAAGGPGGPGGGKPQPVEVLALAPGPIRETGEYLGTLVSRSSVVVYPQVAGNVANIFVKPGARVAQGQPLLEVDPRRERAGVLNAEAQRSSALSQRQYAQSTRKRAEQLLAEGLVSRQDYEQSVSQSAAAEASASAAEAQLQAQQVELSYYRISAPFEGVVGSIPVKVGDYVTPQTPLTSVDQSQLLEISVSVPAERASQVKVGTTLVEVLGDTEKPLVSAPVFFVAPTPNPSTQLVELRSAFQNTQGLRAAQVLHVRVVYSTHEALRLPPYAVTQQSSQYFVMMAVEGDGGGRVVRRTPVKLGELTDNFYEVKDGLRQGDTIVVGSLQSIRDGQAIEPRPVKTDGGTPTRTGGAQDPGTGSPPDAGTDGGG